MVLAMIPPLREDDIEPTNTILPVPPWPQACAVHRMSGELVCWGGSFFFFFFQNERPGGKEAIGLICFAENVRII